MKWALFFCFFVKLELACKSKFICFCLSLWRQRATYHPKRKSCPVGCWPDERSHPLQWWMTVLCLNMKSSTVMSIYLILSVFSPAQSAQRRIHGVSVCLTYLFHFGFFKLLESKFDFLCLHLRLQVLLKGTNNSAMMAFHDTADVRPHHLPLVMILASTSVC